jgi:signal transduction histidine kinase
MEFNLQNTFNLLDSMPGNLAYYLILIYSITAAYLSVLRGYRTGKYPDLARTFPVFAFLAAAVILPIIAIFVNQTGFFVSLPFFAILERTSISWLAIWVAWLWLSRQKSSFLNVAIIILTIIFPAGLILLVYLFPQSGIPFNASPSDIIWHFAIILAALTLTILLIRRQSPQDVFGIGMMSLIVCGFTVSLIFLTNKGDISGAARLGILCAFPLLSTLVQSRETDETSSKPPSAFDTLVSQAIIQPIPDQVNAWLEAAGNSNPTRQQEEISRILCQALDASACIFLQNAERPGILQLTAGYDQLKSAWIEARELSSVGIPKISEGVRNSVPKVIKKTGSTTSETAKFSEWLHLDEINSMAVIPVRDTNIEWGAVVLFRLAGAPLFQEDDLLPYLRTMVSLTNIFRNSEINKKEKQDIGKLTTEINLLQAKNHKLQSDFDALRISAVQVWPEADLNQVLNLQQASQSEIERIQKENQVLLQALADERETGKSGKTGSHSQNVEHDMDNARNELNDLQALLNNSNQKIAELEKRTTFSSNSIEKLRKFSALTTQIRNPVAAITGYIDLLLSENESPNGRMEEHSTLVNLNSSLTRLRQIMDDLAEINVLESGVIDLEPETMQMNSAIDQAIARVTPFLSEKSISLKLSLPDTLPEMFTYHDALQKVIVHLLQNAGKATPPFGTVELHAEVHEEGSEPYFLLEITDSGGGVALEDLKKVFLFDEEHKDIPIKGLGETSEGLSASKALIEAHGGRIWLESNPGLTTTFSVLLPIEKAQTSPRQALE